MTLSQSQTAALDWARGLSAQAVLFGHAVDHIGSGTPIYIQNFGVIAFFLLSGFLITFSTLNKPADYGFQHYAIDRGARIYVAYLPSLAFIGIAGVIFHMSRPLGAGTLLANVMMLQDFPLHHYINAVPLFERYGSGAQLWTVAVEWWLYMAFGLLAFWRRGIPAWGWLLVIPGVFVTEYQATAGMLALTWCAGACAALVFPRLPKAPWLFISTALAAATCARLILIKGQAYDLQFHLLAAATLFSALKGIEAFTAPKWVVLAGAGLAAFSYSLYLVHYTVLSIVPGWKAIVLSNVAAICMWALFERHYRKIAAAWKAICAPTGQPNISGASANLEVPNIPQASALRQLQREHDR